MKTRKPFTMIASVIFGIIAFAHLLRLFVNFQVSAFGYEMPLLANVFGFIIAGFLSYALWKESHLN